MHRKMSLRAFIANKYIEHGFRRRTDDEFESILRKRLIRGPRKYTAPLPYSIRNSFSVKKIYGYDCMFFNNRKRTGTTFFYLHGGAFTSEITLFHCHAISRLAVLSGSKAIVPLYPLIPYADYRATTSFVERLYLDYKREHPKEKIVFVGDSAGGGLALTMSEIFAKKNIIQPEKIITFSPWLDVSMSNPRISEFEDRDVLLYPSALVFLGKKWAGALDTKDYRVSPRFGDLSALENMIFYVGTEEILYPDVTETYEILRSLGKNCTLHVGENMSHVYPVFPIPEGLKALKMCAGEIIG